MERDIRRIEIAAGPPFARGGATVFRDYVFDVIEGKLDPQIAFVQGKLRVDGDINKAIEFGALLPKVAP